MKHLALAASVGVALAGTETSSPAQTASPASPVPTVGVAARHTGDKVAIVSLPTEDGLLRDGLNQSSRPQSLPIVVIKPMNPSPAPPRRRVARERMPKNVRSHQRQTAQVREPAPIQKAPAVKRRSPVVSLIYRWNGWVLRTFRTKVGTVMLGTFGAEP